MFWVECVHGRGIETGEEAAIPTVPPPKRHPYNQWTPDARALDLVGDKWTLLIVRDLAAGPRRFVELQRVLPGISTEQLRSRLNRMVADGLLTRQRYREVPPRVDYELTDRAQALLPVLGALAQWGYQWAWDSPRGDEAVDIGAIFRVAPGLIDPADGVRGLVEMTVIRPDGEQRSYAIRVEDDEVAIEEREAPEAEAQIAGAQADWIRALGPAQDRDALRVAGDERLAMAVLDAVSGAESRIAVEADVTL
ncbi:MAG: helix-turn-helix transcriptional regulator [Solirubrobacteraceae bacterium]|nr:helix-turn-helix transcriptional regulator [Solirubrobacteraceae bacterium]